MFKSDTRFAHLATCSLVGVGILRHSSTITASLVRRHSGDGTFSSGLGIVSPGPIFSTGPLKHLLFGRFEREKSVDIKAGGRQPSIVKT